MKASAKRLLFSSVALLALAGLVQAQETRARITGRVTDPSKAAVPKATVKVADVARGTVVSSVTNEQGLFQANYLLPGTYEVTVEASGFKKHVTNDVVVQMNETRDVTIALEVGKMEETVSVSTEAVALNTSDGNIGLTIDTRRLADLPIIHGDPYKLMGTATGLSHTGDPRLDRPYEPTHIIGYAMDGTRGNRSDLLIDGSPSTATANANEVIATYVPPSDLVQEFKVQTATFDAQFGNTEGGVTSITIKSGTNKLHGSAYYFAEPDKLGANDFFGKAAGQPRVKSSHERPGFVVNGPIVKDKTFFTVGYEHIKDARPRWNAAATNWSPTQALRSGDFSAYSDKVTIYDPATRVSDGKGGFIGQAFPGNIIPADRISPVAKAVLNYYGMPLFNDRLEGNMNDSNAQEVAQYNSTTVRLDQQISSKNRMFVRGSYYKRDSTYNDYLKTDVTTQNFQFISYQGVIDDVHMFSPTTVLNVRYGYNRFERNSGQMPEYMSGFDLTQLAFPAAYNGIVGEERFPRFNFDGSNMFGTGNGADFRPVTSHTVTATVNKSAGAHAIKLGAEMRIYREDSLSTSNQVAGEYTFQNTYTRQSTAASTDYLGLQAYASFLLGLPSGQSILRASDYSEYSKTWSVFIHDDWRVSPKLTLNVGVRYEIETPLTERQNKSAANFDYSYVQPIQGTVQDRYATVNDPALKALVPQVSVLGGLTFAGSDVSRLYTAPKNTILPRFGFSYQLARKTVVRGGVGLFAGFLGERRGDVITTGFSRTTSADLTTNDKGAPIPKNMQTALLSTNILAPVGNAQGRQTNLGGGITFFNPEPQISKQLRYQIGLQRELPGQIFLEAAYVGNYGYDIEITRNINALSNQYLNTDNARTQAMNDNNSFLTASVTNPFAGLVPGQTLNNATTSRQQMLLKYPGFGTINTTNNDGKSWYNSVQVGIQKRFAKGTTLGLSYTYSHWMQQTEYLNAADPAPVKVISDQDAPHRLSATAIFELPFGKGKRLLGSATGLADAIIGGWQVQGVYTIQSGYPIAFTADLFYDGSPVGISNPTTQKWFNTDAFYSALTPGVDTTRITPANHVRTNPLRFSDARSDGINNLDVSVLKNVQLKGEMKLQLRAEFVNALNQTYLPVPNTGATAPSFGTVTGANQRNYPRRAQLGVKLIF